MLVSGFYEPEVKEEEKDERPAAHVMGNIIIKI